MKLKNTYYLLRHGESLKNVMDFESCWPEKRYSPLTKKGKKEAKKAGLEAKSKKIDIIFHSNLLRTKQTAKIVGKILGVNPESDKRLREVNIGIFNGQSIRVYGNFWDKEGKLSPLQYYSERYRISLPRGENYRDLEKRLASFIGEVEKKYKDKNILIISHQRPLTLLEKVANGYSLNKLVSIIMSKKEVKTGELRKLRK